MRPYGKTNRLAQANYISLIVSARQIISFFFAWGRQMSGPEVFSQVNAFRLSETSGSDKRYGTSGLRSFFML